jgi:hypothetical protein
MRRRRRPRIQGCIGGLHGFFTPSRLGVAQTGPSERESGFHSDGCCPAPVVPRRGWNGRQGEALPTPSAAAYAREAVLGLAIQLWRWAAASVIAELLCRCQHNYEMGGAAGAGPTPGGGVADAHPKCLIEPTGATPARACARRRL